MSQTRETVLAYWAAAEARDWDAFGALLAEHVVYELPQTGERIRGRARYVQFNVEYPGDWHVVITRAIADDVRACTWTQFTVDGDDQDGLSFFEFDEDGRIARVTDFWPQPYAAPPGREHLVEA